MMLRTTLLALLLATPARAQVTTDPGALDSLAKPAPTTTAPTPAHRPPVRPQPTPKPSTAKPNAPPAKPPVPPQVPPPVPPAPPPAPVIPPPIVVPTLPQPPPPPVPVVATAIGVASDIPDGIRITFGPDSADLNPATLAGLTTIAHTARDRAGAAVNVLAHAPGAPEDPSTPRRLSLSRALAARAVLISQGIASTRIYVRALGPLELGDGPADRVDVILGTPPPATPPSAK